MPITKSKSQPHVVSIKQLNAEKPLEVDLYLQEQFSTELTYAWAALVDGVGLSSVNRLGEFVKQKDDLIKSIPYIGGPISSISETLSKLGISKEYTRMTHGYPDHLKFTLPCRLWTDSDPDKDVYEPIKVLEQIATVGATGKGFKLYDYKKTYVSVLVGNFFYLPEGVILSIQKNYSKQMVRGTFQSTNNSKSSVGKPMVCDVNISLSSKTIADWDLISKTHINISASTR